MPRHEAIKALEIYKSAGQQAGGLSDFYEVCKGLELARNFQFPALREPPQSFLSTMEEYIKEAPRMVDVPTGPLLLTYRPEEGASAEDAKSSHDEPEPLPSENAVIPTEEAAPPPPPRQAEPLQNMIDTEDLLGLNSSAHDASVIEDQNALALAIITTDTGNNASTAGFGQAKDFDPTGWELSLVTTPSTNLSAASERQLAGGLDTLILNSLYDEGAYRAAQRPVYGAPAPNPFEVQDPFALSTGVAPPHAVQMATMAPQQQHVDNNPFGPYQPTYQQPQQQHMIPSPVNPFGDTGLGEFPVNPASHQPNNIGFGDFPVNPASHQPNNNPFGSTGLL